MTLVETIQLQVQHWVSMFPWTLKDERGVVFAHKTGVSRRIVPEARLVITQDFAYALALLSKEVASRTTATNVLGQVSKRLYDYVREKYRVRVPSAALSVTNAR